MATPADTSRDAKRSYLQLSRDYAEWQSHLRILPSWGLGVLLVGSFLSRYIDGLPRGLGIFLSVVGVLSLLSLARREGHREGWVEGYDSGYDDGRFAYLGIDAPGQEFLSQIEADRHLEQLKKLPPK